jgi:uncharacterized membrane protein YciS (DUF1049 family)
VTRSTQRSMCAAILVLEAVVLFLTGVVSIGLTDLGTRQALGLGIGLAVLCVLAAGMLGRPFGYALGWLVQAVSLALGFVVATMFFLGAVFAALWATAYFLGRRIDEEKAERQVAEERWRAEHEAGH